MAATKQNKIDSLATKLVSDGFRVEKFPSLSEFTSAHGYKEAHLMFDAATEQWRQRLERAINQNFRADEISTGDTIDAGGA